MKKSLKRSTPTAEKLRLRAEKQLGGQNQAVIIAETNADSQRLIHELQVHQIELEMQNVELHRAQMEAAAALGKYTELYDFAPVGYLSLDQEGSIHEANLAVASLLEVNRSELINHHFEPFVSPADRSALNGFLKQVFSSKSREHCGISLKVGEKPAFPVELEAIASECGRVCRVAITDITDRKRDEEARMVLSKLESTGILAGGIAHDFNNLLATLILGIDLAQQFGYGNKELEVCLNEIKITAFKGRRLSHQLLTFATGGEPHTKAISMPPLLRDSTQLALGGSPVRCDFSFGANLWFVTADEGQIAQVVHNLVLNAKESMPGGGLVSIHAENVNLTNNEPTSNLPPGRYVRVNVVDQGMGIPPDYLPRVFDPYFSTKERGEQKGMGLGLTVCHTIIKKHGGAISVKSQPNKGTIVEFVLPAAMATSPQEQTPLAQVEPQVEPQASDAPCKILLMDDDGLMRELCGKALRKMGHEVELVTNGETAIKAFLAAKQQGRPFGVVFLDLTIRAGMGGAETIKELHEIDPAIKAILMSGYTDDLVVAQFNRHGFAGLLVKPFDILKIREVLGLVRSGKFTKITP